MARPKQISAIPAPGAGTVFALRAIGLVLAARWAFSMSQMGYLSSLRAMTSSPWACLNVVLIFLLIVLPGAKARVERPLHPLPQWLRQALRFLALFAFGFAMFSVGAFVWSSGWRPFVHALAETNGWLLVGPALYAVVMWICRPRALWRTNVAARRFSIGRYAISLDPVTRTAVVWAESRKLGQYDARELSMKWPTPPESAAPSTHMLAPAMEPAAPSVRASGEVRRGIFARAPKVELLWDSPAAAGHNRKTVFRAPLANESDRNAARALDTTLRQI
ncbi:hypothetical protein [Caballeronia insecticola]|uniref:Conserved hypothetical membrane protein n=1 Tax=Caballeronia insecticola TaxID=758793 RepID=R4WRZ1_9BURK|nr:hypothetical protein [Caballeronia insecticola]BAN23700.1 conserved hypothetical membrane protein [Caballeronia insecticola]